MTELVPMQTGQMVQRESRRDLTERFQGSLDPFVRLGGSPVVIKRREVMINNKKYETDPAELITMIKAVTQSIGEYKAQNTIMADYMIHGLRQARTAMVTALQQHFRIFWTIDKSTGESIFTLN